MRKKDHTGLWAALTVIGVVGILFGFLPWTIDVFVCHRQGTITGRHTEFHLVGGCYIAANGGLIPFSQWRAQ